MAKFKLEYFCEDIENKSTSIVNKFKEESLDEVMYNITEFLRSIGYSEELISKYIPEYPFY